LEVINSTKAAIELAAAIIVVVVAVVAAVVVTAAAVTVLVAVVTCITNQNTLQFLSTNTLSNPTPICDNNAQSKK
jgi:hypothetical protein